VPTCLQGRPQKEVPVNAISGNPVEGSPPLEEEMHACTWPGCPQVFPTLPACSGHISSHKPEASEAAAKAGTGRLEQQESQAAASRQGEESHEKVLDSRVSRLIVVCKCKFEARICLQECNCGALCLCTIEMLHFKEGLAGNGFRVWGVTYG
jgi:hypothetical protein